MKPDSPVIIIGGGWAGLSAALELVNSNIPVKLYESAPQLGGRARNAPFGDLKVDNGQHLLIGAYHETLRLLKQTGASEAELFYRTPLNLKVLDGNEHLQMNAPRLPAPFHLAWAQLSASGLSLSERLMALSMSLRLMLTNFHLEKDTSVLHLLEKYRQSEVIVRRFWEPLCIATLNTPIHKASAQVFLRVLRDSFTHRRSDSDLLIPMLSLGDLFPERLASHLRQHNVDIVLRSRVEKLHISDGKLQGLTIDGNDILCSQAILATAPRAAGRLMRAHEQLQQIDTQLDRLGNQPIVTVYLQYPENHQLEEPMIGLCGTISQWLFDRHHCRQTGLISVVISAEGPHLTLSNQVLIDAVIQELSVQFPDWPSPIASRVIREKHATFECQVGVDSRRPQNTTPVKGLWLAGDYTDTGYPATLEGAVRSAVQCAQLVRNTIVN